MEHSYAINWERRGAHVHMRIYVGPHNEARGFAGELCMRTAEFEEFRIHTSNLIEFRLRAAGAWNIERKASVGRFAELDA